MKGSKKLISLALILIVTPIVIEGQTSLPMSAVSKAPAPKRDAAAIAQVQKAIGALGGAQAIQQIADLTVTGTISGSEGSMVQSGTFTMEGDGVEFRSEVNSPEGRNILATSHGHAAFAREGSTRVLPVHMSRVFYPIHMPGSILLRYLNDPLATIEMVTDSDPSASTGIRVRTSFVSDPNNIGVPPIEWTLDPQTSQPTQMQYWIVLDTRPRRTNSTVVRFSDYRKQFGILIPYHIESSSAGAAEGIFQVTSATANSAIPRAHFDLLNQGAQR